jgi:CheY-like chemotaxis protein
VRADIPAELDQIYQRATAKNPDERYPAMDELIDALARLESTVALSDVRPNSTGSLPASQSPANVTMASAPLAAMESCDFELNDSLADAIAVPSSSIVRRVSDIAVVLVEPSRFQARIAQRLLADLHIENVLTAGSGREALELSRREGTTVVLSSMELPDMTGMQLAQALHDDPGSSGVGFVVASTNLESLDIKNPLDAPPVVYLAKPFDSKSLAGALAQATGRVVDEILG